MIKALINAVQQKRGTGYLHADLPASTLPIDELIGTSSFLAQDASVYDARVAPKDQSGSDSCCGQGGAQCFRLACLARGIACPDLSALYPYKLGRASIGLGSTDGGMTFSALQTAASRFGFASEESWSFSLMRVNQNVSATALHDGYDRRGVRGYFMIDPGDIERIRKAIYNKIPVLGAFPVDDYFGQDGPELIDAPGSSIRGYHALPLEDYRSDGTFGILNSYGPNWRSGGRARFTEAYVKRAVSLMAFDVGGS